ncbi:uncharacterized protein LOC123206666 [Mangifera indica]|uniref:uncharacterized protein LOC123206666 n=1 Tax=Mangifera indica TaxID=29780 RepID=UPI001CF9387A|nr:uncharacterized protein LOC123206666 [Mangifera indica]
MKRVPRIKFPQRHRQSSSSGSASQSTSTNGGTNQNLSSRSSSDVPAPPRNTAVGGTASLQPKRTPVSDKEIEAILLGGCF